MPVYFNNTDIDAQDKQKLEEETKLREEKDTELKTEIGDLNTLKTESKDNIVNSINSIERIKTVSEAEYNQLVNDGTIDNEIEYHITTEDKVPATDSEFKAFFDAIYPVGSIYLTMNDDFNPETAFGGKWEKVEKGRYLRATDLGSGTLVDEGIPVPEGNITLAEEEIAGTTMSGGGLEATRTNGNHQVHSGEKKLYYYSVKLGGGVFGKAEHVTPLSIDVVMWRRIS